MPDRTSTSLRCCGPAAPPTTRRELLQSMTAGFGIVGLSAMLGEAAQAEAFHDLPGTKVAGSGQPLGQHPHFPAKCKRVVFLFMNGGPSHVDSFDPKPALKTYAGQQPTGTLFKPSKGAGYLPSPFEFKKMGKSGIEVSETLPRLGALIDDCCVIRSMHTDVPNHEPALLQMHTGNIQPIRPSMGSWLLYGLGTENQNLPGYVVLRPTNQIVVGPALWSNSFLPAEYQAAGVITQDMRVDKLVANIHNPRLNETQQREQIDLLERLNGLHLAERHGDSELNAQIKTMETAYRMQTQAMKTFDISQEPASLKELYGDTAFGRSCMLARRLIEDGVRCVSVYYVNGGNQPWDTHESHNKRFPELCADSDRASAALIMDLKQRGLLDDTLVIWSGEFGRTPYAENSDAAKIGRDHHHTAFSLLMAGGGIKGGMVYGESDEFGLNATVNPVHIRDFHATVLKLMGLDHRRLTYRYSGRDFRLTDTAGTVIDDVIA
jgi:hypothetical protein